MKNLLSQIRLLEAKLTDGKTDEPEEKDYKRLEDIVTKSKGSEDKMLQLCRNMAKSIKDALKAKRRAEAAKEILPPSIALKAYQIFMNYGKVATVVSDKEVVKEVNDFIIQAERELKELSYQSNLLKKNIEKRTDNPFSWDWQESSSATSKMVRSLKDISNQAKELIQLIEYR
jgi:hypothetical protein